MPTITKSQRGFLYWIISYDDLDTDIKLKIKHILLSPSNEYVNSKELNFLREKFIEGYIKLSDVNKKFLEEYCGKTFYVKNGERTKYWFSWKCQPSVSWVGNTNQKFHNAGYDYDMIHTYIKNGTWLLKDEIIINID